MENYIKLENKIEEIFKINNSINILYWDMSINTPKFSLNGRKEEILTSFAKISVACGRAG